MFYHVSQKTVGNAVSSSGKSEPAFLGVIEIDKIGIIVLCCYVWDNREGLAGRNAPRQLPNPPLSITRIIKKTRL